MSDSYFCQCLWQTPTVTARFEGLVNQRQPFGFHAIIAWYFANMTNTIFNLKKTSMSSRLSIARITTLLLMLLGGFGMAMAGTGGGSPKKNATSAFIPPVISDLTISNGGNVINSQFICANRTITITPTLANGASVVSYSITPSFGLSAVQSSANSGNGFATDYYVEPAPGGGSITIVAQATNLDGTSNRYQEVFTVLAEASGSVVAVPPTICLGSPVAISLATPGNLTVTGGSTFTGPNSGANSVSITPTTAGANSFSVSGTNAPGCSFATTVGVTVNATPNPTVFASSPVCAGSPVSFSLTPGTGASITSATVTSTGANQPAPPNPASPAFASSVTQVAGSYTVTYAVTDANGCTATASAPYVVSALPANGPAVSIVSGGVVLASGNATAASTPTTPSTVSVCQNSSVMLSLSGCSTSSIPGGSSAISSSVVVAPGYVIITTTSGTQFTINNGITTYPLPTTAAGTQEYEVACVNDLGCSSTAVASFTLTVLPTPNSPTIVGSTLPGSGTAATLAGQNIQLCQGQSLTATINCPAGSAISATPTSSSLYATPTTAGSASALSFTLTASATASGSQAFTVSCNSTSGSPICPSVPVNYTLTVNPRPTSGPFVSAMYSNPTAQTATIDATTTSSAGAITVCQNTTLMLSVTGCTTSAPASVSTNPIIVITPGGSIGSGASVTLAGAAGTGTYIVSTSAISTSATGPYIYTIVCQNTSGCSSSAVASLSVTVNPSPDLASITAVNGTPANLAVAGGGTGAVAICQGPTALTVNTNCLVTPGASGTGSANAIGGSSTAAVGIGASTSTTSGTFASFTISAATTGTFSYSFACQNAGGCLSPQYTVLTVTVNASVAAPTSQTAQTVCLNSGNLSFATGCASNTATIVSSPATLPSFAAIQNNALVVGTANSGTFVYGVVCQSSSCTSTVTNYTAIVNPRPNNASLTAVNGTPANLVVAGGTSGAVAICQGSSLTVLTDCLIASASSSGSANTATGINSGVTGVDGSTAAVGGGTTGGTTSQTFASFAISTTATGTTTFTFACVNSVGCASPQATTLTVTVNASVVAPTYAGTTTACVNSNALSVSATCSTPSGASLVVTGANGVASIADVNSTSATGTRSYTLQCVTPTCVSSTTSLTVTVRPRPSAPSLTPSAGGGVVAAVTSGTLVVCQGATGTLPLSVTTSCVLATAATSASGTNGLGGLNPGGTGGATGTDGTTASAGGAVGTGGTSTTFASFSLGTANTGTTTYTFVCVNEFGCASPDATTLTVTVNSSVAAPTITNAMMNTACQNSGTLGVTAACSTPTGASLVVTQGGSTVSLATLRSTTATPGTYTYTLQCVTSTCVSSTTSIITTIRPRPANAGLTPSTGAPIAAGAAGSVAVCQGAPLSVTVTGCPVTTGTVGGTSGTAGTSNSSFNVNPVAGSSVTATTNSFTVDTGTVGTFSFTVNCTNEYLCTSPQATTITVTVNSSVAAPTFSGQQTACQNSNALAVAASCSTPTGSSLVITNAANQTVSLADVNSTSALGSRAYTLQCVTPTCVSSTTSLTVTVRELPANAGLTVRSGSLTLTTVSAGTSGSVAVCQNQSLTVVTSCVLNTSTASGSANVATGANSGSVGQDGSIVAIANGVTDGTTSTTYAAFVISTSAVNTTVFTFACQNQYGCTSPVATTLALVVSSSVAPPTVTNASQNTACQNSGTLGITASCATGSSLVVQGASGLTTLADLRSTTATPGTYSYTLSCATTTCTSSSTVVTKTINARPNLASLTAVNGIPANLAVAGGQSGSVSICQGSSLTVLTDCFISSATTGSSSNTATGASSGAVGQDGSTSATAGVIVTSGSSVTNAAFLISTNVTGTSTFTFNCVNQLGCTSPTATTLTITVNQSASAPTSVVASQTVCQFASLAVTPTCAVGTPIFSGAQSFTGASLAVVTGTPGTFVYSVRCRTAAGCESTPVPFTVVVNAQPNNAAVAATPVGGATTNIAGGQSGAITVCEGTAINGLVTGCPTTSGTVGGGGAPIAGTGQISVGGSSPVSTTSSTNTFSIPGSLTAGTYNYTIVCTSVAGSATCVSPQTTTLVVNVNPAPASPTGSYSVAGFGGQPSAPLATTTNITVCQNSPISLTVVGCNPATPGSTNTVPGQTSGSAVLGGSQVIGSTANNSFFTIPNATAGVFQYTVVCTNPVTGCTSLTPIFLNVTVNPTPDAPVITGDVVAGSSVTLCQGKAAIGTVTCPVNSIGTLTSNSFGSLSLVSQSTSPGATANILNYTATASTSLTGVATFSVVCVSTQGGCPSLPTAYTLVVNPVPANAGLTVSPATLVGGSSVSTVAPAGGAALTICQGNPISVTVTGCPTSNTAGSTSVVAGGSSAGANFGGVQIIPGATGVNVFTISTATTGTFVYTANCTNSFGCSSSAVTSLTVTVNPTPGAPTINSGVTAGGTTTVCLGQSLVANITCPTGSTLAFPGTLTRSGSNYTVPTSASGSTTYSVTCIATNGGCPSTSVNFTVIVRPLPNNASLTVVSPLTLVPAPGPGNITVCQGSTLRVNTDCLIGSVTSGGTGNSLTAVNSGNTGNNGVIDNGGSGSAGVGGGQTGGTSTPTYASFNLGTSIATTTTYTFVCVNQYGCTSPVATTLNVTVNAIPPTPTPTTTAGLLPAISICETGTATSLTIGSGCPTGTSLVVTSTGSLTGGVTGLTSYTVRTSGLTSTVSGSLSLVCVNTTTGCVSPAPAVVSVTVNAAPARPTGASISAGNPAVVVSNSGSGNVAIPGALTICQGQPVSLTVDGCVTAAGSSGGTAIGGSGSGFVFTGSGFVFTPVGPTTSTALVTDGNLQQGTYTFDVRCTNANGCQSLGARTFSIVVTGQPSAVAQTGFAPTCANQGPVTGTLSCAVGTVQAGIMRAGTNSFTAVGANVTLPAVAGIYSLTARCSTGGACIGTPISLTLYNQLRTPAPTSVQTVQNAICLGQSTTLVAGCPTPGATAIWYFAGTSQVVSGTAIGATSLVVSPPGQGTIAYEAVCSSSLYACNSARSTDIILTVLPGVGSQPTISAQPNPTVAGAPVTLTGAGCAGTTIFYVQGTNTEVGRGTGSVVSVTVNPQVTTIYDAVCTNGQCTSPRTTGLVVTVTPCTFAVNVSPASAVICPGQGGVQLSATGGVSYVWNNGANTQTITATVPGIYQVIVTSAQGCTAVGSATVTAGQAPTPTITGNTNLVAGQSTQLTAGGGAQYLWNGPGVVNGTGSTQTVGQAGTYTVIVTSASGCTAAATVTVTVQALPNAPTVTPAGAVGANAPLQACVGQTVQLVATCATGTPRFKMGSLTNDASTQNVSSASPGLVQYQVVCVQNGAEGPATTASVNFNAIPTVQILQTGVLCSGQPSSATLSATGGASYTWSTGQVAQSIVINAVGMYSVNGANAAGCVATAAAMVSSTNCGGPATVLQVTGATVDCTNGNVTITATGGNGNQIQYSIGGAQYSPSNPVAVNPTVLNDPNTTFIQLYARQVNSTSTGFDVAGPFQFNLRAACPISTTTPPSTTTATPVPTACGSPTNTIGQPLVITGVTNISCSNGTFSILVTGGNGQPINWGGIVGLSNVDPYNCRRQVDNSEQLDAINDRTPNVVAPFQIWGMQVGGGRTNVFSFDFDALCPAPSARVATAEAKGNLDVTVLGNPTLGETVEVEVRGAEGQAMQLRVVDGLGAAISEKSVEKAGSVERQTISLGRSAGMYFLQVTTPDKSKTVKVVRQ